MVKPAFVINARNKGSEVGRAVAGALRQTVPCEVVISDQGSTDNTFSEILRAVTENSPNHHTVKIVECPIRGPSSMLMANLHFEWAWQQTSPDCDWIFQCSADDYSLPQRVEVCLEAIANNPCSSIATTMYFENPADTKGHQLSGYPSESGYIVPGVGITNLAYGSCIAAYSREFLTKVGSGGHNTIDVLFGFFAALDKGFYVVANPQHVHVMHADPNNAGFGGRMRSATGDEAFRVLELNNFQLVRLYLACAEGGKRLYPNRMSQDDWNAVMYQVVTLSSHWVASREELHNRKITPGMV